MSRLVLAASACAVLGGCGRNPAQAAHVSDAVAPATRNVGWVNAWFDGLTQTGVAADVGVEFRIPGFAAPPCKYPGPHQVACQMPGSYYKVERIDANGTTSFPHGIFIENQNNGYHHGWADSLYQIDVEIWPKTATGAAHPNFGPVRFTTQTINHPANGGLYTNHIGRVTLPQSASAPYLNGYVKVGNVTVRAGGPDAFEIVGFQASNLPATSTGQTYQSLFDTGVVTNDGYYHSGPIYPGRYDVTLTYTHQGATVAEVTGWLDLFHQGELVRFDLAQKCFGLPSDRCFHDSRY